MKNITFQKRESKNCNDLLSHEKSPRPFSLSLSLSRKRDFLATHKFIIALSIVVFIFALFLRLGFAYQKSGFMVDESLSVAISTGSWIPKFENGEYFGKEIKEKIYFDDNSISDLFGDLKQLWKNNYGDSPHLNLYYSLLRAWSFDIKSGDFAWIKSRGIGLNLIFFAFGFYAVFILATKIFSRNSLFVPLFLAVIFWNSASVSNTIFLRPYALQEMLLLVFVLNCFVFYKLHFTSAKEAFKVHRLFFAWFIFATALLCLSHYFSLFFIALAFIFLTIISRKNFAPLSVVVVGSFAIAQILYLSYFSSLLGGYRAKESTEKLLLNNFWQNLNQTFSGGADIITTHFCNIYGFIIICVACGFALYKRQTIFKMPRFAFASNLKAFFIYFKPIIKNALKSYKKIFIALSVLAIFAYIVAFALIISAKDNTQNANIYLDSLTQNSGESPIYTAKIAYKHIIFNARSKTVSNLIVENIAWDNALDALSIQQIKNRWILFTTTQELDIAPKPRLGVLSYRVDFTPLLGIILRYYIALVALGFAIAVYIQYIKIAWSEEFERECESKDLAHESKDFVCESALKFLLGFFIVGVLWFCLILFVAPYKSLRYVMPIFPFLYFGVLLLIYLTKKPLLQGILGIAFVSTLFINYSVEHLYKTPFIFAQNPKIPVFVHLPNVSWQQGVFVFAFNDTQKYIADANLEALKVRMREFERFYLISELAVEAPLGYKQVALQKVAYCHFYEFAKNNP